MKATTFPLATLLLSFVLLGCDVSGSGETVILNQANSVEDARPTVGYVFAYNTNDPSTVSNGEDDLDSVLSTVGFTRSDVVSATVDSVKLERRSAKNNAGSRTVFDYLDRATAYLGSDANGKRIADRAFDTTARTVSLSVVDRDVTSVVKGGSMPAFLQLETEEDAPEDRRDRVEVTVYFQIKVQD